MFIERQCFDFHFLYEACLQSGQSSLFNSKNGKQLISADGIKIFSSNQGVRNYNLISVLVVMLINATLNIRMNHQYLELLIEK